MDHNLLRHIFAALFACLASPAFAQDSLAGSRWLAEAIAGAVLSENVKSRLEVLAEGRISGNSGCNSFGGAGQLRDGAVKIGMLAGTRMACPPAIMDQERKFLAALGKAVRYEATSNGRLVLRDSGGAELVRFSRM
jgi:putative lipoprotein